MAYYALHELKILPGQYVDLPQREKAFVIACIQVRVEKERREMNKPKRKK